MVTFVELTTGTNDDMHLTVLVCWLQVNSLVALAHMHLHGLGIGANCEIATDYFKAAAEVSNVLLDLSLHYTHCQFRFLGFAMRVGPFC